MPKYLGFVEYARYCLCRLDPESEQEMSQENITDLFPLAEDTTTFRKLSDDYVSCDSFRGQEILCVEAEALRLLSETAFADINHLLRPGHLAQLAAILEDPEATDNDRFVAYDLLKNANIAAPR